MEKMAGSYNHAALGRRPQPGQMADAERTYPVKMIARFLFELTRLAFLLISLYGAYSREPAIAWLFGILFVHSLLDPKFYMKPNLMDAYLLFTVVFYYTRWVMGWGEGTVYKEQAPDWVRVIKDVVWAAFVLAVVVKATVRGRLDRRSPLWFTTPGLTLLIVLGIHITLPLLSLIYARGSLFEVILWNVRYPLEYIPIVFLFAFILQGQSSIRHLRFFIPLIILSLLFLAVEMFSGRRTGFDFGGIYVRYGSIIGSPNDFGVFMMLSITVLLAFLAERAIKWSFKVVALLILCLGALASTVSLSAIFAMVFSTITLVLFARNRVKSALTAAMVVVLVAGLYFAFPEAGVSKLLTQRIENLSTLREDSAYGHYTGIVDVEAAIERFEPVEYLVGTLKSSPIDVIWVETYYLRTLYLRGALSLASLLCILGLTLFQGYRRYSAESGNPQRRGLFLATFLGVAGFAFAALFIPHFETFPSNFYFWFLVAIIWCEPMSEREISVLREGRLGQRLVGARAQRMAPGLRG
jgi:hypothetical protein